MAIGTAMFFYSIKNKSVQELEHRLKELKKPPFMSSAKNTRRKGNKQLTNNEELYQNHLRVIEVLIKYKTMYPDSNLSDWTDFRAVEEAVELNTDPTEIIKSEF